MYQLKFNGYFEVEDPTGFMEELEVLKKKYDAYFFGNPALIDLGHYVDFQKIEDDLENNPEDTQNNSEDKVESDEKV